MLKLVYFVWYVCAAVFLLYLIACIIGILAAEKKVEKSLKKLTLAISELAEFWDPDMSFQGADALSLSLELKKIRSYECGLTKSFEFYVKQEIAEDAAEEYNESAKKYNALVNGFGSCAVARVIGKTAVLLFEY